MVGQAYHFRPADDLRARIEDAAQYARWRSEGAHMTDGTLDLRQGATNSEDGIDPRASAVKSCAPAQTMSRIGRNFSVSCAPAQISGRRQRRATRRPGRRRR